ncbi:hypothetical protein VTK73DRAFT_5148 [Phialemonium thermophilum]|uniref:Uncharacterized protein n=1 Tax=Phialemonium thermophilum TaxID=223376 RepID=A0ABR3V313_9PEZI
MLLGRFSRDIRFVRRMMGFQKGCTGTPNGIASNGKDPFPSSSSVVVMPMEVAGWRGRRVGLVPGTLAMYCTSLPEDRPLVNGQSVYSTLYKTTQTHGRTCCEVWKATKKQELMKNVTGHVSEQQELDSSGQEFFRVSKYASDWDRRQNIGDCG